MMTCILSRVQVRPLAALKIPYRIVNQTIATVAARHKFLVYAPDLTDPQALERRLQVRSKHLENAWCAYRDNVVKIGGAMVTPESLQPGADKKMTGSVIIVEAETVEEVKKLVESDVYFTGKVWDPERLVITPFFVAIPEQL